MRRTININYKYHRVGLDSKEREEVMNNLLEENLNELMRIIGKIKDSKIPEQNKWEVVKALFNKQGTASFTILNQALDDKVFKLKESAVKKPVKIHESSKELGKTQKPKGKSLIDKAFDKHEKRKD